MNLKHLVLSALLLSSSIVHADTIGWGNRPGNPNRPQQPQQPQQPQRPSRPNQPTDPWGNNGGGQQSQARSVEANIQNYFNNQSRLDLLLDQYIRSQLQGLRIRDITIVASTEQGQGQAFLVLNGQSIESSKVVARQMASYTFRVDPFANVVGQSLRTIELSMQGRFYVEKVIFNLLENSGPNGPGPTPQPSGPQVEVVRQQLDESIQQEGGLELFRMFNLGLERQGQAIRRVTVLARSARGMGQGSLMINNQQASSSQNIGFDSTRLTFELSPGMRIGQEIQGLRLYFRGDISVEEVSIEIVKRGGGQFPPSQERRFEQVVNQRLYDTNGVDLQDLMQIPSQFSDRLVDSIELTLRNSDMGVRLKLCQVIQDQYQSVNCGAPVTISPGSQVIRIASVNFAKLRELSLSSRMGMIDIDRIAINFK
ncbi:MAG: hypothetical protein PHY93_13210 [Bacteriovorax sp.]|nr:hypothetical protein [Bacteriovorax sp.]